MRPTWAAFRAEYPDYRTYPDSFVIKQNIGGAVDAAYIGNTCAIRLSRALNYSGLPVPGSFAGLLTVKGGDGLYYALRVAEMRKWLQSPAVLGTSEFDHRKKRGEAFDKATLAAFKGIIAFDIRFSDATGHVDIWDGRVFSSEYRVSDYWVSATRITLWTLSP